MAKKRYILCIKEPEKGNDELLINAIKSLGLGWWHWFPNTWLLSDANGKTKASELRDIVHNLYPGSHLMVFELSENSDTWSGFGPNSAEKNMFKWIKKNWTKT